MDESFTTVCFWQKLGEYEHEVVADYDEWGYVPNSQRYSGRHRPASY